MGYTVTSNVLPVYVDVEATLAAVRLLLEQGAQKVCILDESYTEEPVNSFVGGKALTFNGKKCNFPLTGSSVSVSFWLNIQNMGPVYTLPVMHLGMAPGLETYATRGVRLLACDGNALAAEFCHTNGNVFRAPNCMIETDAEGWIPILMTYDPMTDVARVFAIFNWKTNPVLSLVGDYGGFGPNQPMFLVLGDIDNSGFPIHISQVEIFDSTLDPLTWVSNVVGTPVPHSLGGLNGWDAANASPATLEWPSYTNPTVVATFDGSGSVQLADGGPRS